MICEFIERSFLWLDTLGYGIPFQYYSPYRRNGFYNNYRPHVPTSEPAPQAPEKKTTENRNSKFSKKDDDVWLDLFGIKLYFDDVLILSLLFFLYKEEVKDEGLFLALVMLLIS